MKEGSRQAERSTGQDEGATSILGGHASILTHFPGFSWALWPLLIESQGPAAQDPAPEQVLARQGGVQLFLERGDEGPGGRVVDAPPAPTPRHDAERHGAVVDLHAHAMPSDEARGRLMRLVLLERQVILADVMTAQDDERGLT